MLRAESVIEIAGLVKSHGGLRPLRVGRLAVGPGEIVSLHGFDAAQAEVMVGLVTGALLPDEGEVRVFGESTAAIDTPDRWLASLDRIGLVSARTALVDVLSVAQNIAVPITLDLDPLAEPIRREVGGLAAVAGIRGDDLDRRPGEATPGVRARALLARALALRPRVLVLEHASATLPAADVPAFSADISRAAAARGFSVLALTADRRFARALGGRRMSWQAATGAVHPSRGWARWF